MNCPSRTDEPPQSDGHNQSPNALANDLTTNEDLNGLANARRLRRATSPPGAGAGSRADAGLHIGDTGGGGGVRLRPRPGMAAGDAAGVGAAGAAEGAPAVLTPGLASPRLAKEPARSRVRGGGLVVEDHGAVAQDQDPDDSHHAATTTTSAPDGNGNGNRPVPALPVRVLARVRNILMTFYRFVGPGFIVAVAYIDPGNYSTDIAAGASYRFRLLFVVLLSNLFAIFLQSLAIKLGTVTGLNLAEACRAFLPRWLNYALYALAELAIIATDIAEVIGTAIALNLLQPRIPLVAGCAISIIDVLLVLFFCRPGAQTGRRMRAFELLIAPLVLAVVICFCIQLSFVHRTAAAVDVLRGYVPSAALVQSSGLYQACGILGATVMPHSIYLGSGIVQGRLREYDAQRGLLPQQEIQLADDDDDGRSQHSNHSHLSHRTSHPLDAALEYEKDLVYVPSLRAIRHSMKYAIAELALSLFTFALFVNSAILVVAGAALYGSAAATDADIFAIHDLLVASISPAAGTIFALALLFSGLSAGVVCTVAGQMVCEGALRWSLPPWLRRLITRSISILPSIVIAGAIGRDGLDTALNATQVALSIVLPFVTAPLIWFTCCRKYMTVQQGGAHYAPRAHATRLARSGAGAGPAHRSWRHRLPPFLARRLGLDPDAASDVPDVPRSEGPVDMANSWPIALLGLAIWILIAIMNVANLVLLGQD